MSPTKSRSPEQIAVGIDGSVSRVGRRSAVVTPISRRSAATGVLAGFIMAAFYVAVVSGASGSWTHLRAQVRQDWPYLAIIIAGFADRSR